MHDHVVKSKTTARGRFKGVGVFKLITTASRFTRA